MRQKLFLFVLVLLGTVLFFGTANAQWVEQNSGTTANLISISAPTYQIAWVAGSLEIAQYTYEGVVKRTTDNGSTWIDKSIPNTGQLWNVYAFNENIAFVIGYDANGNNIWRTADGGNTWSVVLSLDGSYNFMNAISFFDEMEGIVVGDPNYNLLPGPNQMLVYKTYDGGLTWAPIKHPPKMQGNIFGWKNSIEIVGNTVYFGTAKFDDDFNFTPSPYIYKSANKGETWTARVATNVVQVNTLLFTSKQVGYGCRGKSTDNGNTWFPMDDPYATVTYDINNFILSTTGVGNELWVTGIHREGPNYGTDLWWNYPTIYYSDNGGMNWTLDYTIPGTGVGFNEVRITRDNRALFALKDNGGIIMKMLPGSMAPLAVQKKYELTQNYPNPFNPTTTITYQIPQNEFVTLKIYDLLGKEVAELVNEVKNAGQYNVQWNASALPSGTYFYKIQAGSFTEVKRMLLIK
jgi:photosystem II stability/assembly factor-like uncharacterized protein